MTGNDLMLIKRARCLYTDFASIEVLAQKADTEEAKKKLEEISDEAFRIHERIAFEFYD